MIDRYVDCTGEELFGNRSVVADNNSSVDPLVVALGITAVGIICYGLYRSIQKHDHRIFNLEISNVAFTKDVNLLKLKSKSYERAGIIIMEKLREISKTVQENKKQQMNWYPNSFE